ncbi:hypothetical protein [Nocardia xishanensis]|uniref:hypothetical protein n=1 Tax=Nocardia xishanensis TaxID=238964 RepID=UPI00082EF587|nr:hypothetical protein [Nocardia xishanensis]
MHTNLDARNAVITAIEANGTDTASRDQYDIDAIVTEIHTATGGYDVDAIEPAEFWAIVERHQLATVNIVILDTTTEAPGVEYGLAVGDAPALDTDQVRAFLDQHGAWNNADTDIYALVVPEDLWNAELYGRPYLEVGVPAQQLAALNDAATA